MTPDIEQIRDAVTVATTGRASARRDVARQRLSDNAPSWLAACITEIERLRVALYGERDEFVILAPEDFKTLVGERNDTRAELDAWRALAERLIQDYGRDDPQDYVGITAEYRRLKGDS